MQKFMRSMCCVVPNGVESELEVGRSAPAGIDGDQAVDLSRKTASNFIAEILRVAYGPIRKLIATGNAEAGFAWKEIRAAGCGAG
jgi:hypothetical protein